MNTAPKVIAEYLKVPDPKSYTSHSFRVNTPAVLARVRADLSNLMQKGKKNETQTSSQIRVRDPLEIGASSNLFTLYILIICYRY